MAPTLVDKVEILVNGRSMKFKRSDPITKLLILEKDEDYEHSIAPHRVILEFDGYKNTYELAGCYRCRNLMARQNG